MNITDPHSARERGSLPAADAAHPPGLGLRREPARGVRDLLRGRDPAVRPDLALPRAAPRRPAAGRQLRARSAARSSAARTRTPAGTSRSSSRRSAAGAARRRATATARSSAASTATRSTARPRSPRHATGCTSTGCALNDDAGRRGRAPRRQGHRARLPRALERLLLHLRVHAEQAPAVGARTAAARARRTTPR